MKNITKINLSWKILFGVVLAGFLSACGGGSDGDNNNDSSNPVQSAKSSQAILGPLSGANVQAFRLDDLSSPVEMTTAEESDIDLDVAGSFDLELAGIPDDEWILVTATGGQDIDYDDNGIIDDKPTPNNGSIHALARASSWRSGGNVTALTEIYWQYVKTMIGNVHSDELEIRLNDLTKLLISKDINGDGRVDHEDALHFNPRKRHKDRLKFDYRILSVALSDGDSLLQALHRSDETIVLEKMEELFGSKISFNAAQDTRYKSIKVKLKIFGEGRVESSDSFGLKVDSSDPSSNKETIVLRGNPDEIIIFTATPTTETEVISWNGCDEVTPDLMQCSVRLDRSKEVLASFGRKVTEVVSNIYDLSNAQNTLMQDSVDVVIPEGNADLVNEVSLIQVDDFIVGSTGSGFLRKVTGITKMNDSHYLFETVGAALDEVIKQGTGVFHKEMTNGDLLGYSPSGAAGRPSVSGAAFRPAIDGISLVPSSDPNDRVFRFSFGGGSKDNVARKLSVDRSVTLYCSNWEKVNGKDVCSDTSAEKVEATGGLSMEISLDFAVDYKLLTGLKSLRFISDIKSTESLMLSLSSSLGSGTKLEAMKKIGTLYFGKMAFAIGPVPVWISPKVDIVVGINGRLTATLSAGIEFAQRISTGIIYDRETGFDSINNLSPSWEPTYPSLDVAATLKGYIRLEPKMQIYDATGPSLPMEGYLKAQSSSEASLDYWLSNECNKGIVTGFYAGMSWKFMWDFNGKSKIGKMLHLDKLEDKTTFTLIEDEWKLKEWSIGGNCVTGAVLEVVGSPIQESVKLYNPQNVITASNVVLKNVGDEELSWSAVYRRGSEINVTPDTGTITPGGSQNVTLSVDSSLLSVGLYDNPVLFKNTKKVSAPDSETGNKSIPVTIRVLPEAPAVVPVITSLTSPKAGVVQIEWDFDLSSANAAYQYFEIFSSTDPSNPSSWKLERVASITTFSAGLSGFSSGSNVSFRVEALGGGVRTSPSDVMSVKVAGTAPPININNGLVGYYQFDGDASDASGNGNNGTVEGVVDYVNSSNGTAISFDDEIDRVTVPQSASLQPSDEITISAWVKYNSEPANFSENKIVSNSIKSPSPWSGYWLDVVPNDSTVSDSSLIMKPRMYVATDNGKVEIYGDTALTVGQWHHVAAVYGPNRREIYVDGIKTVNQSVSDAYTTGSGPIRYGNNANLDIASWDSRGSYNGEIDELRIYSRALSPAEISTLAGVTADINKGLIAYYPFDGDTNENSGGSTTANGAFGFTTGVKGQAAVFNGSDNSLVVGNVPASGDETNLISTSVWINSTVDKDAMAVLTQWTACVGGVGTDRFALNLFGGNNSTIGLAARVAENVWASGGENSRYVIDGQWHNVISVFNGNTMKLYIDGKLYGVAGNSLPFNYSSLNFIVGAYQADSCGYGNQSFDGAMDELRIYDRPLNESEISILSTQ